MFKTFTIAGLATALLFGAMPAQAGRAANGTEMNGVRKNGMQLNGMQVNSIQLNALGVNGGALNACSVPSMDHGSVGVMMIVAVELPAAN